MDRISALQMATGYKYFACLITAGVLACAVTNLQAKEQWQSHQEIRTSVEHFLEQEFSDYRDIKVSAGNLDKRLKLLNCTDSLNVFWPPSGKRTGNVSVGVSCEGTKPWKLYVQAKVATFANVAVLVRPVVKGEILTADLIRLERQEVSKTGKHYIADVQPLLGFTFGRNVNAGNLLLPRMLQTPLFVKKGQHVTIVASNSALQVRMAGEALADGTKGDIVRVKNLSSSRVVQGEVLGKGLVKIYH